MKVIGVDQHRELKKSKRIVEKESAPTRKPERKTDPQVEALQQLAGSIKQMMARPIPAPQITVPAPSVNIDIPKPAKGWKFRVHRNESGYIETVDAERID